MPKSSTTIEALFKMTFNTEVGQRCLERLEATFVDRPMFRQGDSLEAVSYRQGQSDVIKQIIKEVRSK